MNKTLRRLLAMAVPLKGWMMLASILGCLTIVSGIGLMATSAYLISAAALHPSVAALSVAIVGVRFFGIARGVFRYLERYLSHSVTFQLLARIRVWFYQTLEPLAPARLMTLRRGKLTAYSSGDVLSRNGLRYRNAPTLVCTFDRTTDRRRSRRLADVVVLGSLCRGSRSRLFALLSHGWHWSSLPHLCFEPEDSATHHPDTVRVEYGVGRWHSGVS